MNNIDRVRKDATRSIIKHTFQYFTTTLPLPLPLRLRLTELEKTAYHCGYWFAPRLVVWLSDWIYRPTGIEVHRGPKRHLRYFVLSANTRQWTGTRERKITTTQALGFTRTEFESRWFVRCIYNLDRRWLKAWTESQLSNTRSARKRGVLVGIGIGSLAASYTQRCRPQVEETLRWWWECGLSTAEVRCR